MTVSRSTGRPRVAFELEEKARPISIPRSLPARSARDSAGRGGFLVLALVILVFFCGSMALVHRLTGDPPPGAPLPPSLEAQVVTAPPPVAAPAPSTVPSAQLPAAPPVRPVATVVSPPPAEPVSTAAASRVDISFKLDPRLTRGLQMGDRWVSPPTYTSAAHTGADVTIEARALARDSSGRPMRGVTSTWTPADPGMVSVSPAEGGAVRITVKRRGRSDVTVTSGGAAKKLTVVAFQESGLWRVDIAQR
jgi:hypothetical protein